MRVGRGSWARGRRGGGGAVEAPRVRAHQTTNKCQRSYCRRLRFSPHFHRGSPAFNSRAAFAKPIPYLIKPQLSPGYVSRPVHHTKHVPQGSTQCLSDTLQGYEYAQPIPTTLVPLRRLGPVTKPTSRPFSKYGQSKCSKCYLLLCMRDLTKLFKSCKSPNFKICTPSQISCRKIDCHRKCLRLQASARVSSDLDTQ